MTGRKEMSMLASERQGRGGRGGTHASVLAKDLVEVAVLDTGGETRNVKVVSGVGSSSLSSSSTVLRPARTNQDRNALSGQRIRSLAGHTAHKLPDDSPSTISSIAVITTVTVVALVAPVGLHTNGRAAATLSTSLTTRGRRAITFVAGGSVPFY